MDPGMGSHLYEGPHFLIMLTFTDYNISWLLYVIIFFYCALTGLIDFMIAYHTDSLICEGQLFKLNNYNKLFHTVIFAGGIMYQLYMRKCTVYIFSL